MGCAYTRLQLTVQAFPKPLFIVPKPSEYGSPKGGEANPSISGGQNPFPSARDPPCFLRVRRCAKTPFYGVATGMQTGAQGGPPWHRGTGSTMGGPLWCPGYRPTAGLIAFREALSTCQLDSGFVPSIPASASAYNLMRRYFPLCTLVGRWRGLRSGAFESAR
jgi:hypothetical protein